MTSVADTSIPLMPDDFTRTLTPGTMQRALQALHTQDRFDRAQVAWLIAVAYGTGYGHGHEQGGADGIADLYRSVFGAEREPDGESATLVIAGDTIAGITRKRTRDESDRAARQPRPGDHPGGPVPTWDTDRPNSRAPAVSARVRRTGATLVWADA